jgi:hypothetical protein
MEAGYEIDDIINILTDPKKYIVTQQALNRPRYYFQNQKSNGFV